MIKPALNPYWDEVQKWPRDESDWKYYNVWRPDPYPWRGDNIPMKNGKPIRRDDLCIQYAWSIPDPVSLEFVSEHLGEKAVEIGAGVGYWGYCLAQLGTHVICYDIAPPHRTSTNFYHSPRIERRGHLTGQLRSVWREVYYGNHNKTAHYTYPLFLCWPPMTSMATKALKAYRGNKLIYIGEDGGGCTAEDSFFLLLAKHWHVVDMHMPVQWSGIHDCIYVYERGAEQ